MKKFLLGLLLLIPFSGHTSTVFNFSCISDSPNCAAGESGLSVEVSQSDDLIQFSFSNTSASSLTQIYFDNRNGVLVNDIDSITNGTGVNISETAPPPGPVVLPDGNNIGFNEDFDAGALAPGLSGNGVGPGETLLIFVALADSKTLADVTDALRNSGLRIGVHVQSFLDEGSASFVTAVPVPAAVWLFGSALGFLGLRSRRVA